MAASAHTPGCIAGDIDSECPCEQGDAVLTHAWRCSLCGYVDDMRGRKATVPTHGGLAHDECIGDTDDAG